MKTKRTSAILLMAFLIEEKGGFTKQDIVSALEIADSSFFLALSDFRCFLVEHRPYYDLCFDKTKGAYRMERITIKR